MKASNIIYTLLVAGLLAACNNAAKKETPAQDSVTMTSVPSGQAPAENAALAGKLPDPVCGMPYDTMYHEFSVYQNDTVHFCSPTCKRVFDKNPEKYAKSLGL